MAGPSLGVECADRNNIRSVLASEGVEFLLSDEGKVPLSATEGKIVCLFFSANWCRPCRTFTPQLVQIYDSLIKAGKVIEIIFISFDRDETGFGEHFKSMPWLAIPFDVHLHRRMIDRYHVDRIPSFIPLGLDGKSIEEDAIELIEDYGASAFPFTRQRREELKAMDNAKRQGGKLELLLENEGRNHVISCSGREVLVTDLVGKTIGLYFAAHWCPPCRTFTTQLIEAYNKLVASPNKCFEIIFVSTDRDRQEFDQSLSIMPWLAIPYEDKARQDLCRIFDIKGIPALVLLGSDGKTISTNGRAIISSYGAMAFPFTESRTTEIEAALKEEGDALPRQVKDPKHEHVLKRDMAKAYVCDSCKKIGRFWAFSCDVCNYDLHPTCVEEKQ